MKSIFGRTIKSLRIWRESCEPDIELRQYGSLDGLVYMDKSLGRIQSRFS